MMAITQLNALLTTKGDKMDKEDKILYENYFNEEPKIEIKIDDAEFCKKILEEYILKTQYKSILDVKQQLNILDNLTKEINKIEQEINDIYNKENIRYIVNNITHDKSVLKSTKQIGIYKWE